MLGITGEVRTKYSPTFSNGLPHMNGPVLVDQPKTYII